MESILGRCEIQETGLREAFIVNLPGDSGGKETQSSPGSFPGLVGGCLPYPGFSSRVTCGGSQGNSVRGRFAGKSCLIREASRPGGLEEQGGFQHLEMELVFWARGKSIRKDTEKRSTE